MASFPKSVPHRSVDRRKVPRLDAQGRLAIHVLTERRLEARLHDFSQGGFMVRCPRPLAPGSEHQVLIASRQTPAEALDARVAYCREYDAGDGGPCFQIGFEFVSMNAEGRRLVNTLVDELSVILESISV